MYLYGASGHAKVILDFLKSSNISISGLFDDNPELHELLGYPVLGAFSETKLKNEELIIAIGSNSIRKQIVDSLVSTIQYGRVFASSSEISKNTQIGSGTVIMQGAIVQTGSNIGKHVIINTQASVDHDCFIQDFVHISPHSCLCGHVAVGKGTHIGAGAVILPGIKIGRWSHIGAGAVVTKDISDYVTVVGNPAKIIRKN